MCSLYLTISQVIMDERELKHDCMGCLSKIWTAKVMIGSFIMGTCETLHLKIIVYNSFAWCVHLISQLKMLCGLITTWHGLLSSWTNITNKIAPPFIIVKIAIGQSTSPKNNIRITQKIYLVFDRNWLD